MFRNRRNSQKPNEELYSAFKHSFPRVGGASHGGVASGVPATTTTAMDHTGMTGTAMDAAMLNESALQDDDDHSPRAMTDQWRLTPSLLDPNSFTFAHFANQAPGYWTPTPGGLNTVYHNQQAGDLHTPGAGFGLGTPLSLPLSDAPMTAGTAFDVAGAYPPSMFQPDYQPFQQPQGYAPRMLVHQDSGYAAMDGSPDNEFDLRPKTSEPPGTALSSHSVAAMTSVNNFRYHVTLNAPTAMIRQPDEIPISYLNKGQAYTLSMVDTRPGPHPPTRYRTVIRISFEDDQQRQRPAACWQLWKEGRGLAEAHQRGGKLQAVEFVDPHSGASIDEEVDPRRPRVELASASFDGFAVTWTPSIATTTAECSVAVRFNFLSTDFSHSKGVKGIPVRLCAKTVPILDDGSEPPREATEVCYCKVKLFRDHGAERKLANDVAHVKKTIDKLQQQRSQLDAGLGPSKRKRTGSLATGTRPGKALKSKRTWSISSNEGNPRPAAEDDLHQRLAAAQSMFSSTRPASVLYLKGSEQDDPDDFPVALPGGTTSMRTASWPSGGDVSPTGSDASDTPSPALTGEPSESKTRKREDDDGEFKVPKAKRRQTADFTMPMSATLPSTNFGAAMAAARAHAVPVPAGEGRWFEAMDVDPRYAPPQETLPRAIACFYARMASGTPTTGKNDPCYRAIYLAHRTTDALVSGIAAKSGLDPSRVARTVRVTPAGLHVVVDDEVVRELAEGTAMVVSLEDAGDVGSPVVKREDEGYLTVPKDEQGGSSNVTTPPNGTPLEMRLAF